MLHCSDEKFDGVTCYNPPNALLTRVSSSLSRVYSAMVCKNPTFESPAGKERLGMVYQYSRIRKRVHAIRRGPDGSAFQKCEKCGLSVAIALADMHECESNNNVKKLKRQHQSTGNVKRQNIEDQPRSAFRFFMEELVKKCEEENEIAIDRKGFESWKEMSEEEKQPYVIKAEKVNSAHIKALLKDENDMSWVDDEADSAKVGKFDKNYEEYEYFVDSEYDVYADSQNSDGFLFWSEISDSYDSKNWAKMWLNLQRN